MNLDNIKKTANIIGIDAGSISCSMCQMDHDGNILKIEYGSHQGRVLDYLKETLAKFDLSATTGFATTSDTIPVIPSSTVCDSRIAFITASQKYYPEAGSLLIVGGEKFGLVKFDEDGQYSDYRSNSGCAAGTGSFLDQQAKRLNLDSIEEFCQTALANTDTAPKIATRCAVFAKTDLIHAQQEGYSMPAICDGLSAGLAKNIADTLFKDKNMNLPLVFAGGVSLNESVVHHLEKILGHSIEIHEHSHCFGSIGTALDYLVNHNEDKDKLIDKENIFLEIQTEKDFYYEPLELKLSTYPDFSSLNRYMFDSELYPQSPAVEIDIYSSLNATDSLTFGMDIGSTSTKAVLINDKKEVLVGLYTRTAGKPVQAMQVLLESIKDIEKRENLTINIKGAATTGSGRKFIGQIIGAGLILDEITAHARAAYELDPETDTIIEIGGQDAKFTTMRNGMVTFSIMNNVCAAGTGSFIEEQAKKLGCGLTELSDRAASSPAPLSSDRCTVFMERDGNHYLAEGYSVENILASVLHSVRENYITKVANEGSIGKKIFFQGATAKNKSLVAAFEQKLNRPIMVSPYCHLTGALGAALVMLDDKIESDEFQGLDLYKMEIPIETEVCTLCNNNCKITLTEVGSRKTAYGFLCGRDYDTLKFVDNNLSGFNLLRERKKILAKEKIVSTEKIKKSNIKKETEFKIGIPPALYLFEELEIWQSFFKTLGIKTVTSLENKNAVKDGKPLSNSEMCAPIQALFGHVNYLQNEKKADYIFLPVYLEEKQKDKEVRRQYCYYTQYAPAMIINSESEEEKSKFLNPVINSLQGKLTTKVQLYKMIKKLPFKNPGYKKVSAALDNAYNEFNKSQEKMPALMEKELENLDEVSVVLLGRPYSVLNKNMNNGIIDIFANLGIKTFFQDMLKKDPKELEKIHAIQEALNWNYAAKILEAAWITAGKDGVYPVLVTSFKCTPDVYVIEYFKEIMDAHNKPYLILQLDEHDSSVGYETRIEAAIRAFKGHYKTKPEIKKDINFANNDLITKDKMVLKDKTLLIPAWDPITSTLLTAALQKEGIDARMLEEDEKKLRKSLSLNTGQCLPLSLIAQNTMDYIDKYNLKSEDTILWSIESRISCNLGMFSYYLQKLLKDQDKRYENISIFNGSAAFIDMSISTAVNAYFAYMFGGLIKKIGCKIRPYEKVKGSTDKVLEETLKKFEDVFKTGGDKEAVLIEVIKDFEKIETVSENRPKVAIFGDLYVRDNDMLNQNLIQDIENNGGEVIITPYNEFMKIIIDPYIKKWKKEGLYSDVATAKLLKRMIPLLEKKYLKHFNKILKEPKFKYIKSPENVLGKADISIQNSGESMENVLKIEKIMKKHPDLSLFVQTGPAYCCPHLVSEAMAPKIEKLFGVPIVSIEYDGTGGLKNHDIIPYLKYGKNKK